MTPHIKRWRVSSRDLSLVLRQMGMGDNGFHGE
jgi:hypothetical protein